MQSFSQAQLAIVAYGQVSGATGTSTLCNSGITTTRLGQGTYQLGLPAGSQNQLGLTQLAATDIVQVTPLTSAATPQAAFPVGTMVVNNVDSASKLVLFGTAATTAVDCDFSFVVYRTLTPSGPAYPGIPA